MAPKRFLTFEDQKSDKDYLAQRRNYTDEQAQALGYASAKVLRLADDLSKIAGKWRVTKDDLLVDKYQQTLYAMILNGYDVDTLPVEDQLPEELMPDLPPEKVRTAIKQAYESLGG